MVITRKNKPVTALAWILAIIFIPFGGAIMYLVFGTERIVNKGRVKMFSNERLSGRLEQIEEEWAPKTTKNSHHRLPEEMQQIIRLSRKFSLFDVVGSNSIQLLTDVKTAYGEIEAAIQSARHHVNLEYYLFRPDEVGERFRDLLVKKAKEGVKINFLYDAIGSWKLGWDDRFLQPLRDAGVKPVDFLPLRTFFKPWNINLRNHRKILVVDDKIGFTGSLNIGREFLYGDERGRIWRETHLAMRGPAVTQLQWIFCEDWYFSTGEELLMQEYFLAVDHAGEEVAQVVASGPDVREKAIHKVMLNAISQAKKSVYLTTPYFIPDQALSLALQLAALREVDVKILVPKQSDHTFVSWAGRSYYDELLKDNVEIYEYLPGYLHAKMLVVDGFFSVIGSANTDIRSFDYDFEVNVQVYSDGFAARAERVFLKDLQSSQKIDYWKFAKRSAYTRFGENVCRLFSPLL